MDEPTTHEVTLILCSLCLRGAGGECHTPGCALWINRAPDLPLIDHPCVLSIDGKGTHGRAAKEREPMQQARLVLCGACSDRGAVLGCPMCKPLRAAAAAGARDLAESILAELHELHLLTGIYPDRVARIVGLCKKALGGAQGGSDG